MIKTPRNPNHGMFVKPEGYKDLGWQVSRENELLNACVEAGHKRRQFDNSLYLFRGTEHIHICDECKFIYHIDSSD